MLNIDRLISALDLVDLATQAGAKLHRAGQHMRSTCPLHIGSDNPTSFCIRPPNGGFDRQTWICHKCGRGDALTFIQKWRGLDFMESVRWGAQEARIPLDDVGMTDEAIKEHQARERRRDVLDLAAKFYHTEFKENSPAIDYATGRGFNLRTLTRFGFSSGSGLAAYLIVQGADLALAREIGLLRSDGLDFVANSNGLQASPDGWLIYIHRRGAGRVDYLSARAISPQCSGGDKSRNLPGPKQLYRCDADAADELVVLVEGQADAETLRQIGVNAWALCGASLDESDVVALRRRKVYLALDDDTHRPDGDDAKREERALSQASKCAKLSDKLGPLTLIATEIPFDRVKDLNKWLQFDPDLGKAKVMGWLKGARPWLQHRIEAAALAGPLEQAEHICEIAALLSRLPEPVKAKWYRMAGKALDMTPAELKSASGQDGHGPAASVKDGELCMYGAPLITGIARITCERTLSDGSNLPTVQYMISGRLKSGEPLHELPVPAAEFESLGWMNQWGARLIKLVPRGRYHEVVRAIQEISLSSSNGDKMQRENMFTHTGLTTIDGQLSFLTRCGRLTANGLDANTRIDLGDNLTYALPDPPRGEALRAAVRAAVNFLSVSPLRITAPLLAAAAAAPLTTVRPLNTMLWLYGITTTGKSIIAHLALSFFAPGVIAPRRFIPMVGWSSTSTALEGFMFASKDVLLVIDDFHPEFSSKHEADKLRVTADRMIRQLGNRMARQRAQSDLTLRRSRNPRALVLSTSEHPIEGQSLVQRLVYIPVERGDVIRAGDNAVLSLAEEHGAAGLYAGAMSAYICWLLRDWNKHAEQFNISVDADVQSSRSEFPQGMDRQPDYFAVLDSAQRMMLRAWSDLGALDPVEAGTLADKNRDAILQVVRGQSGSIAEQSPAVMFIRAIDALLDQRKCYLAPRKKMAGWAYPDKAERVGWFDPSDKAAIWLHSESALAMARVYWEKLNVNFDIGRDGLQRALAQSGLLRRTDDRQHSAEVTIWDGNRNARALEIDIARVLASEQLGFDLTYPRANEAGDDPSAERPFNEALL